MASPLVLKTNSAKPCTVSRNSSFDYSELLAPHNVTITNTMIKVTYDKSNSPASKKVSNGWNLNGSGSQSPVKRESVFKLEAEHGSPTKPHDVKEPGESSIESVTHFNDVVKTEVEKTESAKMEEVGGKKKIIFNDPSLPKGWKRKIHCVKVNENGTACNQVCIVSPQGLHFYRKARLQKYLLRTKSNLSINQFSFCLHSVSSVTRVSTSGLDLKTPLPNPPPKTLTPIPNKPIPSNKTTNSVATKPKLPTGWSRKVVRGDTGEIQIHFTSPVGKVYKSRRALRDHLRRTKSKINIEKFYGKSIKPQPKKIEATKNKTETENQTLDSSLPQGWRRLVHVRTAGASAGRKSVYFISPDGQRIDRKQRLIKYLADHNLKPSLKNFNFSLNTSNETETSKSEAVKPLGKTKNKEESEPLMGEEEKTETKASFDKVIRTPVKVKKEEVDNVIDKTLRVVVERMSDPEIESHLESDTLEPMFVDPDLPDGWTREIKVRKEGASAGRLEVYMYSPEGRRIRTKKEIELYFLERRLPYDIHDFDFSVYGKNRRRVPRPVKNNNKCVKQEVQKEDKVDKQILVPEEKEEITEPKSRETSMIQEVSGYLLNCALSTVRTERRLCKKNKEQERLLRQVLEAENHDTKDTNAVPETWIQRLAACRSDFLPMETDAVAAIAAATNTFVNEMTLRSFHGAEDNENGLQYEHVADLVEKSACVQALRSLIPQKITFRDFRRLNRPNLYTSFT